MKLGLYVDLRNPEPWKIKWSDRYRQTIERVRLAEELGLESVWMTEHHLFEDGYLPQPLTFAAALAASTDRVTIGTSVLLAPLRQSIDIAEQAAVVDILSGGRLELGLGAGYRVPEFEAFGVDMGGRYELLEDRAASVRELWNTSGIAPPPIQEEAPIWIGAQGPRGARIAGRVGGGLLSLRSHLLAAYTKSLAEHWPDQSPRCSGPANLFIADDPEATWSMIEPHVLHQANSYLQYGAEGKGPAPDLLSADDVRVNDPEVSTGIQVLTPADAVSLLREWLDGVPVEHVYFWENIAGLPDDICRRHIELLATEVAPALS